MRLASRFGRYNSIRRERPLTDDELMQFVPSVFSGDKHESRSERYTYIPTINIINKLRDEGFQPFFACQSRVRDLGRREYSKHMLRLRREGHINGQEVPEIILLNSHDGSSSYQMIPGIFRFVCTNGLVCGNNFGEIRVPHKGDIVGQVIEGAYEVLGVFDKVTDNMEAMKEIYLNSAEQHLFGRAALMVRYEDENKTPVTPEQIITPRRWEDKQNDLWTTWQRVQENMIKGGLSGRSASGKNTRTRAITGIDGDIRNVLLPSFANAFTEAGFATITFDYRGFGESEGERGRLVPAMQTEDIISVINWAEKQVCIDNQRIGLWGTSLGGCHVFNAAAQDKRVKSIVSQLAFADGEVLVTGEMNELEKASFLSTLNKMAEKKKNTGKEMFVGVTRVLSDNESKVFFEKVKGQYPEMDIKIPFLTVMETLQYKPAESAAKVQCPVLVVIAGQDSVNPPEQGRALYDAVASGTKELYEEADACHYDIYEGAFFERVAAVQTQWFKKHL